MAEQSAFFENRPFRMVGNYKPTDVALKCAVVEEGINHLTATRIEFVSRDRAMELKEVVGCTMNLEVDGPNNVTRTFHGLCVSAEFLGLYQGFGHFAAEVRPWLWFLTRRRECKVYQAKSAPDIIQDILTDYGFWGHVERKLTGTYEPRDFCLQYRETDLDFVHRLMEEEGIYYFFTDEGTTEKMVLADAINAHKPTVGDAKIPFHFRSTDHNLKNKAHIYEWSAVEAATSGKMTLNDYDFERPKVDLKAVSAIPKGSHSQANHEMYAYPGHYRDTALGKRYARVRMEAEAARHQTWKGAGNIRTLGVGQTFKIDGHPRGKDVGEYMVTRATHYMQIEGEPGAPLGEGSVLGKQLDFGADNTDHYRCVIEAVPKSEQYRAPLVTPWPEISSIHTAVVVGPAGEEIHTDKYGRVRVQFHWDREGKKDDKSSVWVRTMMPWTGKNWGMIAIPRIGQEVVVQFEEGNPDRPMVVGMLYNADTMPPYALPDNMTQSGIKTNSTKGGGGFNELMMEDKKGSELVRFQAEKDYTQIVKNNARITVGVEKKDAGNMDLTVHANLTETVKTGHHSFTVASGQQTIKIKKDKTETIEGGSTLTVTDDVKSTVKMGNVSETVEMGNVTQDIKMGNQTTTVDLGNVKVDVKLGKIEMEAMQSIKLTVGGNSVEITQAGVTVKGIMVKIEGTAMLEAKAPMTQIKGDALLTLKGAITLIN